MTTPSISELLWEHIYQPVCVHDGGIVSAIEAGKDPCWWRLVDECGIGYLFGTVFGVGGAVWNGAKIAPPGKKLRIMRDIMVTQTPGSAGSFAAWTTSFALTECCMIRLRGGTEDAINPLVAGAGAGFFSNLAGGRRAMMQGAKTGAMLFGVMELGINLLTAYQSNSLLQQSAGPPPAPEFEPVRGSGGKKEKDPRYSMNRRINEFKWAPQIPVASTA
eukprot:TRINITY_DN1120_c0_g2_i1.p2 TRINITY_DN1120_c0_g2~~TRINITY_DN1120_c0_g2_i1.p2  ORF type:complete len:218 (+),score=68.70 TRINITY_DN1120_c0_g2_i1:49-702(+)